MSEHQQAHPYALPRNRQIMIVGALALVAGLAAAMLFLSGTIFPHDEAKAQASEPRLSRFIPPKQQLAALDIQPVPSRIFHNEVITDGYIAPNGGFAAIVRLESDAHGVRSGLEQGEEVVARDFRPQPDF